MQFFGDYYRHAVQTYQSLAGRDAFTTRAMTIVTEFSRTCPSAFAATQLDKVLTIVTGWCQLEYSKTLARTEHKNAKQKEKKSKLQAEIAAAESRFNSLGVDKLLSDRLVIKSLLEALGIEGLPADASSSGTSTYMKPERTPTLISSASTLGHMLQKYPDIAKNHNVEVIKSKNSKPIIRRGSSIKPPRGRSTSRGSFVSARSGSSRKPRSTSRSRSPSSKRTSSPRSRSRSRTSPSRSTSRSTKTRSRSTSKNNRGQKGRKNSSSKNHRGQKGKGKTRPSSKHDRGQKGRRKSLAFNHEDKLSVFRDCRTRLGGG